MSPEKRDELDLFFKEKKQRQLDNKSNRELKEMKIEDVTLAFSPKTIVTRDN